MSEIIREIMGPFSTLLPSKMISCRVPLINYETLEAEAAVHGLTLAGFARRRLIARTDTDRELAALRREILQHIAGSPRANAEAAPDVVILEALLLLRRSSPPQVVAQVHGELQALGLTPFQLDGRR